MSIEATLIIFVIILAIATVFSAVGLGGGILYVPVLLVAGVGFNTAAAVSLFMVAVTGLSAAWQYRQKRLVDPLIVLAIEPPTMALAFIGGYFAGEIEPRVLKLVFAAALTVASFLMLLPKTKRAALPVKPGWGQRWSGQGDSRYLVDYRPLVPISGLAGFVAGMVGIAGGIFKVPAMVLLGRVPTRVAVGTSALMVAITALAGFSGHLTAGHFEPKWAIPLAFAALLGAQIGARVSLRLSETVVRWGFVVLLWGGVGWMVWNAVSQA